MTVPSTRSNKHYAGCGASFCYVCLQFLGGGDDGWSHRMTCLALVAHRPYSPALTLQGWMQPSWCLAANQLESRRRAHGRISWYVYHDLIRALSSVFDPASATRRKDAFRQAVDGTVLFDRCRVCGLINLYLARSLESKYTSFAIQDPWQSVQIKVSGMSNLTGCSVALCACTIHAALAFTRVCGA